jgi:S1-C subfamily serine protease
MRWRAGEAEVAYLTRQAELKAESEAADKRLAALDSKVKLISLGFREVAKKVIPAVVNVSNERAISREMAQQLQGRNVFYDYDKGRIYAEMSVGSGILVKPGLVLTNNHVVRNAERLRVTFASGNWVAVYVGPDEEDGSSRTLATDPLTDLAVIRLPQSKVTKDYQVTATFADSDKDVFVGDWALAAGSPLGLERSLTHGIISAKGRILRDLEVEVLQTDAPINPGNSGGPLFDQLGRVVGINVAIASQTGGNQGIGFAIPSNTAKEIFTQLAEKGEVVRGYLGVDLRELSLAESKQIGVTDTGAVIVQRVMPGSPAARAGLQEGDIIVGYGDKPLPRSLAAKVLRKRIMNTRPDSQTNIAIVREDRRVTVPVQVGKRPSRS